MHADMRTGTGLQVISPYFKLLEMFEMKIFLTLASMEAYSTMIYMTFCPIFTVLVKKAI